MKIIEPSRLRELKTLRAYELATSKMAVPAIATRKEKNMNSKKKTTYRKTPEVKMKATWRCMRPGVWCKAKWYGKRRVGYQATAEKSITGMWWVNAIRPLGLASRNLIYSLKSAKEWADKVNSGEVV